MAVADPWFPFARPLPGGVPRLVCFPYAGGGASAFRALAQDLAPDVDVRACQLPGRETRLREPLVAGLPALVDALLPALVPHLDGRFAFYGHSFGAQLAYELARRLARAGGPLPAVIFAAACGAPHLPKRRQLHALPANEFHAELVRLGGTPPAVLADRELMQLFEPILRADMAASETHLAPREALPVALEVVRGADDSDLDPGRLAAWAELTTVGCRQHVLPGDHFFLATARQELAELIRRTLG